MTDQPSAEARDLKSAAYKIMQCGDADILSLRVHDPDVFRDIAAAYISAIEVLDAQAVAASRQPFRWFHPSRWRHRKRGTSYNVLTATAGAQCSTGPINEGDRVTVYQGNDGNWWVRGTEEFQDGRFERIDLIEGWGGTASECAKPDAGDLERARALRIRVDNRAIRRGYDDMVFGEDEVVIIAAALAEARRAERERCAKIADDLQKRVAENLGALKTPGLNLDRLREIDNNQAGQRHAATEIAAAIRALTPSPEGRS